MYPWCKGAITSKIKHAIKLKTIPERLAQQCAVIGCKLKQNANEGCNSCASFAGLVLSFIACFILLVIAPWVLWKSVVHCSRYRVDNVSWRTEAGPVSRQSGRTAQKKHYATRKKKQKKHPRLRFDLFDSCARYKFSFPLHASDHTTSGVGVKITTHAFVNHHRSNAVVNTHLRSDDALFALRRSAVSRLTALSRRGCSCCSVNVVDSITTRRRRRALDALDPGNAIVHYLG